MQRFYGGDPLRWIEIPIKYLNAYVNMYGKLQAEESLNMINNMSMGSGVLDSNEYTARINDLMESAGIKRKRKKVSMEILKEMGIGITVIKKDKKNG